MSKITEAGVNKMLAEHHAQMDRLQEQRAMGWRTFEGSLLSAVEKALALHRPSTKGCAVSGAGASD